MDKASNPSLETSSEPRGTFLTVMAVLFVVLALSDFTKALQYAQDPAHLGLVVLGHRFEGVGKNLAFGSLVGIVLVTYAYGIWKMRAWVLPLSILYAFYVPANMVLFWSLHQLPPPSVGFIVRYLLISLTGSVGTAIYLAYHRERLH
jgi:hypothetical protein